jgi:hypothetical protein
MPVSGYFHVTITIPAEGDSYRTGWVPFTVIQAYGPEESGTSGSIRRLG